MIFVNRAEFREWLQEHCLTHAGVWLLFGKAGGPKTIKAGEALEEALCFGWIDGQMQRIDDQTYKKYFSLRRENSKWSEKNKALTKSLEERGLMTDLGRQKIEEAKKNGQWDAPGPAAVTEEQIACLSSLLEGYEPAFTNFQAMSLSVKKTYTRAYFDAKTEAARLLVLSRLPVIQIAPAAGADHPGRRPHRGSACIFQTNRKYRFLNRSPSVP